MSREPSKHPGSLHRRWSRQVVDGAERAASRAMLHAVGFAREDFKKSQVGIASLWSMVTPCNMHLDGLARQAEAGNNAAGGKGGNFRKDTIFGGLLMGHRGDENFVASDAGIRELIEKG